MLDRFEHKGDLYALIIRSSYFSDGIRFFTKDSESLQLAYMRREKNYFIEPHAHIEYAREVLNTQEVLFVKTGKVRVDFYDDERLYIASLILNRGDIIFLSKGGHGFKILEDSEIIEVKQGPYIIERDKKRFDKIDEESVKYI
jgi:hypothetical protein